MAARVKVFCTINAVGLFLLEHVFWAEDGRE